MRLHQSWTTAFIALIVLTGAAFAEVTVSQSNDPKAVIGQEFRALLGAEHKTLGALPEDHQAELGPIRTSLHQAVTELQFHDMATQLIVHTGKVLQSCAWRLAEEAMEPEEGEVPLGLDPMPERPSPVTQSEMDAGSIDLF